MELALYCTEPFGIGRQSRDVVVDHFGDVAFAAVEFGQVKSKNLFVFDQFAPFFVSLRKATSFRLELVQILLPALHQLQEAEEQELQLAQMRLAAGLQAPRPALVQSRNWTKRRGQ